MIVNVYLKVTQKQWEDIKEKYVEPNMYHIISDSKRKHKRCDDVAHIILAQLMKDIAQKWKDWLTEILLAKVGTKFVFTREMEIKI